MHIHCFHRLSDSEFTTIKMYQNKKKKKMNFIFICTIVNAQGEFTLPN